MFEFFVIDNIVILAFFEKNFWVFTKKSAVVVFGFLVFKYFDHPMDTSFMHEIFPNI